MPNRLLHYQGRPPPDSSLPSRPLHRRSSQVVAGAFAGASAFSALVLFAVCFRIISRKRTVPSSDDKLPRRFSYSGLRRATKSFSASFRVGQGGFGSVYRGNLPNGLDIAVKLMDSGSLQGEREFQNELLFASKVNSPYTITALGFSSDKKHGSMVLVYELMPNGNLQDALLHRKCQELTSWEKRFSICIDIAKGIEYLHGLDPPVIHGDIKPSNVLLDGCFNAKIADFGLAWLKEKDPVEENITDDGEGEKLEHILDVKRVNQEGADDCISVVETESVVTATTIAGLEEFSFGIDQSPENLVREHGAGTSLDNAPVSPEENAESREKNWWWKQENGSHSESGAVKDYVMEWIGTEIKKETPISEKNELPSPSCQLRCESEKKKRNVILRCWKHLRKEKNTLVVKKRKEPREWWKEDYCEELEKKKRKKKKENVMSQSGENWWPQDDLERKKNRKNSHGSFDWFSGELFRGYRENHDSVSGDVPKSGGVSSTPSMRGTVCYAAPEYNGGGMLSEKADVYSFGVLLLVLFAGRRPLQVATSPVSNFLQANLIHWARHLARGGKLLDVLDQSIQLVDRDQALLCLTISLLCLQKSPSSRPTMKEVVKMLSGDSEAPHLPIEFSPSPPSHFLFRKSQKKKSRREQKPEK